MTLASSPRISRSSDALDNVAVLGLDLVGLQCGQALQTEIEDRLGLDAGELEALDQAVARRVRIARAADQLDDLVDVVDRDEQALEDVEAASRSRSSCLVRRTITSRWWST